MNLIEQLETHLGKIELDACPAVSQVQLRQSAGSV